MQPNVYYSGRMLGYRFSDHHPMDLVRVKRTVQLLEAYVVPWTESGAGEEADILRVHAPEYVDAIKRIGETGVAQDHDWGYGIAPGDNPPFKGMFDAAKAVVAGSVAAARDVANGDRLSCSFGGGLHHARPAFCSGFCIFNDCAVAIEILRERYPRIAYVDIDVHHGDGTQLIYFDDPDVLTCSIHQDGRTLYPGSGFPDEVGPHYTSVNVIVPPETSGSVWLHGFREGIMPAIERFNPDALVLELGVDSHASDPLARVQNSVQEWLEAVRLLGGLDLPTVALGGGGYDLRNPHRMWAGTYFVLTDQELPDVIPEPYASEWGTPTISDPHLFGTDFTMPQVEKCVRYLREEVHPHIPTS